MARKVNMLVDGDPEFVSFVDRPAARKSFRIIKRDQREGTDVAGNRDDEARKATLATAKARLGVLRTIVKALGGKDEAEPTDVVKVGDVHALVFDRATYTLEQAQAWAAERGFTATKADETADVVRLIGRMPVGAEDYEVVELDAGISGLVVKEDAAVKDAVTKGAATALSVSYQSLRGFNPYKPQTVEDWFTLSNPPGGTQSRKTAGAGGIGATDFSTAVTSLHEQPNMLDLFAVMQGVMFNVLNDEKIADKRNVMANELGKFQSAVLDHIERLPLAKVQEQQVEAELLGRVRRAGVAKLGAVVEAVGELVDASGVEVGDMDQAALADLGKKFDALTARLAAVEAKASGRKPGDEPPGDEPDEGEGEGEGEGKESVKTDPAAQILAKLDEIDARMTRVEKMARPRQGTATVSKTMEDEQQGGVFDSALRLSVPRRVAS